jgi:hypothetical protein
METTTQPDEKTTAPAKEKGKTSFGQKFWNFFMMGGFLILLILGGVGFVVVSQLMK